MTLIPAVDLPEAKRAVLKVAERALRKAGHERDLSADGIQVA
jgi:hypothetical protein